VGINLQEKAGDTIQSLVGSATAKMSHFIDSDLQDFIPKAEATRLKIFQVFARNFEGRPSSAAKPE
jgi:hypothetical protein